MPLLNRLNKKNKKTATINIKLEEDTIKDNNIEDIEEVEEEKDIIIMTVITEGHKR